MSRLLSWIFNGVYLTLLLVASPWILWSAFRHGKYREGFAEKVLGRAPRRQGNGPCIWLHAVSVGEVNLLQTTLEQIRRRSPATELVISTTTKTGYDLARRKYAEHTVFYCPLDFSWAIHSALKRIRPDLLVLAELELWPNLIRLASAGGTKVAIINGRLSDNSFRGYQRLRPLMSRLLGCVNLIAAQDGVTAERFRKLGAENVTVTGSLKFDGATTDRENLHTRELRELAGLTDNHIVFLAGSTQAPEEHYAIEIFRKLVPKHPNLRLILVPRHPERFQEVANLLQQSGISWRRRTELSAESSSRNLPPSALLVDSIGELGAWWGTAAIGFVGGSFGSRGGQNMLEPAAYGVATCFGPNTRNFRDIVARLLAVDGAEVVNDFEQFEQFVARELGESGSCSVMGRRARDLVISQQGATSKTVELLMPLMRLEQLEVADAA